MTAMGSEMAYLVEATVGILIIGAMSIIGYEGVRRWRAKRRGGGGGRDAKADEKQTKE